MTLTFTVYGVAQSKGSVRALQIPGMKFPIVTDSNRSAKSWQQLVATAASHAIAALPAGARVLVPFAVRLSIAFYLPRPKKHGKRGVFVPHCVKPDLDKLSRAVLDALTGIVYHDDRQVTELIQGKYYAAVDAPARVDIQIEPAPGQASRMVPLATDQPLFTDGVATWLTKEDRSHG